jgi:surfactin synthase thioesterase subunit
MTESTPRLFIFPHAGGSASFYVPFSKAFSTGMKRIAVQYPGASGGHDHSTVPSIQELAESIYNILRRSLTSAAPTAFFGHSMGALVAFEVTRRFESAGVPITALFVSASSAPDRMRKEYFRDLSDDELVTFLIELSGTDPKVLGNKDFVDMILPSLRGYYGSIAGYTCGPDATVSCPIYAFMGTDDRLAPYDNVCAWSAHTTSDFAVRVFEGSHFYFADHLPDVVSDVENRFFGLAGIPG